jgi:hypothetical protein
MSPGDAPPYCLFWPAFRSRWPCSKSARLPVSACSPTSMPTIGHGSQKTAHQNTKPAERAREAPKDVTLVIFPC